MFGKRFKVELLRGEAETVGIDGKTRRRQTVLLRMGNHSFSWRALKLGLVLVLCQICDGTLTYLGLTLMGVEMEGNRFLRELMLAYGKFPVLFVSKLLAVLLAVLLTGFSHRRRWIRPLIVLLCIIYVSLAVIPWTIIISSHHY